MKKIILHIIKVFFLIFLICILLYFLYPRFSTQIFTPKGEYLYSVNSPYNGNRVNIYLFNGGATTGYFLRGEVEFENGKKRNIYFNEDEEIAKINWINSSSLIINNHLIKNIYFNYYNWKFE